MNNYITNLSQLNERLVEPAKENNEKSRKRSYEWSKRCVVYCVCFSMDKETHLTLKWIGMAWNWFRNSVCWYNLFSVAGDCNMWLCMKGESVIMLFLLLNLCNKLKLILQSDLIRLLVCAHCGVSRSFASHP